MPVCYSCPIDGCVQEFVSKDNLKKHMKRFHEEANKYKVCQNGLLSLSLTFSGPAITVSRLVCQVGGSTCHGT